MARESQSRVTVALDHKALHRYLEMRNPIYWRQPIQFCKYDEEVYSALVAAGAMARDKNTKQPITVETELDKLG